MQWLKFDRLRWQKGRPETAEYHCEGCDAAIAEHHKTAMLEGGEWRATATAADPTTVGYHLSALYSPIGWLSWERIVRAWDAAQGSDEAIKAFRNTILGETWVETGEAPDWQRLYDRRERWTSGTVPAGGLFLTAGATCRRTGSRSTSGPGGADWKAGSSITWSSRAGPTGTTRGRN
ncbi:Phage terminase large subunit (GpA) [Methylobrevis pamukkalensis]|uniref:Phage terminase large subunit (GpA) n=1 Tax=Methylobrevis pamukkalensis TaxID=1439726 RepID=A0A1E3GZ05_9HYPH|nr:Phage terminase large subunit (GpA) [Methylobrevis pamukkalensis]